jgi:Ala-tRNA(Pro) deacylase
MTPTTPDALLAELDRLGFRTTTRHHRPLFTVEDGADIWRTIPGGHCKNLFLRDEAGALFLLVCLGEARIRMNRLHRQVGCKRLSFGRPELLMEALGVTPGSVTPFALINDRERRVGLLLDGAMLAHDLLNYHPLTNERTTTIARDDLLKLFDVWGYAPRVVDLALTLEGAET